MNTTDESSERPARRERRYATETALPDGRIEISGARSRRKVLIEPGSTNAWRGPLLRVSGHSRAMNATINKRFAGQWDPITRTWTVPASKGIALRAYLAEYL
ncbi:MAG TPA: hypothetical protein VN280_11005 [Variovorax sp.]|nr:hypothetical protein [Variovorax sp.]